MTIADLSPAGQTLMNNLINVVSGQYEEPLRTAHREAIQSGIEALLDWAYERGRNDAFKS